MKLRGHLLLLILGALLPILVFAAILLWIDLRYQQAAIHDRMAESARAMSLVLDTELQGSIKTLQALATSQVLDSGDLGAILIGLERVRLEARPMWVEVAFIDPAGQPLVASPAFPAGAPPSVADSPTFQEVVRTRQPAIADLAAGQLQRGPAVGLVVPVMRGSELRSVLSVSIAADTVGQLLASTGLPDRWEAQLLDRAGVIIAGHPARPDVAGQGAPELVARLRAEPRGWVQFVSRQGAAFYSGYTRSSVSGWTTSVAVPAPIVDGEVRRLLWTLGGSGLAFLLLGIGLALVFGRRIARPVTLLADAARVIGTGETPPPHVSGVSEVDAVSRALTEAARARSRMESDLRQSEGRFRAIVDQATTGIAQTDLSSRFLLVNQKYCEIVGRAMAEVLGLRMQDLTHPGDLARNGELYQRMTAGGPDFELEKRYVRPDGSLVWVHESVSLVRGPDGQPQYVVAVVLDVTEHREAERAVRESEELFRAVADSAPALIRMSGPDALYTFFSQPWLAFTGRTLDEERGHGWMAGIHPDDRQRCLDTYLDAFRARRPLEMEYRLRRADGEYRWVVDRCVPRVQVDGGLLGYICLCQDATDRKQAEAERSALLAREQAARMEAEAANRAQDEFLGTLSHELRTPISAILGWAQVLAAGQRDEATLTQAIGRIEHNARQQAQLIEDLLDVSRVVTGKARLDPQPVDLGPVILAALETIRPAAEAKAIQLSSRLEAESTLVRGDPDRLLQILGNLLSNAVKFTPREGRVEVRLNRTDSRAEIRVVDTGQGIPADVLPFVFERFRQADSTITRLHGGLGLGLAIVRSLVELQGGTVAAASPGEGQGSAFTVAFPLLPARVEDAEPAVAPYQGPGCDGLRVLVVDDEADARALLSTFLRNSGARVSTAGSVAEALAVLDQEEVDAVVSDLAMPGEDGFALVRQVRARPPERGGRTPLVALTAHAGAQMRVRALMAGFDAYLAKPVEPSELAAVVLQVAGRARRPVDPTEQA